MADLRTTLDADRAAVARQLERERHKPVGDPMSADDARKLTDQIQRAAANLWDQIVEAYRGRADVALGYESWDTYCITEFGSLRLRLPQEEREAVVRSLKASGLSNRAAASTLGVSEGTVRNDLKSGAQNYAPETDAEADALAGELIAAEPQLKLVTTGPDRKRYPPKPKPQPGPAERLAEPPPPSDAETFDGELDELDRMVDVMTWLINRGQLDEDERTILAGRVADYSGRLQVIARKLADL